MKRFNRYFRVLCLIVCFVANVAVSAQTVSDSLMLRQADSITISLLTCSPGQQVWSLYGHTAIRYQDPAHGEDLVANYGIFNFRQKFFIPRFVFGLTDYEMGVEPFQMFMVEYAREGRSVVEQRLNLTPYEKMAIANALAENAQPQNCVYRYNYFYDNCTTRARDILVNHLNGHVEYVPKGDIHTSYRDMVHQWNGQHRWARFGNDLLLGLKADFKTDAEQQQFLPDSLREAFSTATVVDAAGHRRPLVDSTSVLLKANSLNVNTQSDVWDVLTPRLTFALLAVVVLLICVVEYRRKKPFWLVDVTLLTLDGLAGLVLLAMIFSQHPTVSLNLQILMLNPLSIIFVYTVVNQQLKGRCHGYWIFFFWCLVASVVGAFFQHYAEGMIFLALTLMMRCWINIKTLKHPNNPNK